uniref:Major facilitator superfamily (MFS) profile domain-containing protein n=1 Tax=Aegilops tauschii subsp. strangulata TaxID=200361 RepID=A0A453Q8C3_AEGTS
MRLMDVAGRRSLLLWTIPVLIVSLVSLVTADVLPLATTLHAAVSTTSIIIYICTFVMGFGPIPGILCSEIFPTRVRGMCIAICSLAFWLSNIAVTYSMPTKGLPLEVIAEFFNVASKGMPKLDHDE